MAATERITIYVTKADKKRIFNLAKTSGKSASEFAKDIVLHAAQATRFLGGALPVADVHDIVREIEFYETFQPNVRKLIVERLQLAVDELPSIAHEELRRQKRAFAVSP